MKQYFTNKFDPQDSAFAKGKAAMDMEGSWAFANWPTYFGPTVSHTDYDWFPIPPLRDGVPNNLFALGIGSTLSISAKSKVADAAVDYLNWLFTTPQRMTQEMSALNTEPLPIKVKASDFPSSIDSRLRDHYLAINDATSKGVFGYTTWTFWPPKSDVVTYDSMDKVLVGNMTPAQFCAELDATFKKELQQHVVPPIPKGSI